VEEFPFESRRLEMDSDEDLAIYGGEPWLSLIDHPDGITVSVQYRSKHYREETIDRLVRVFQSFAAAFCINPYGRLKECSIL